jgi:hypothetical protein
VNDGCPRCYGDLLVLEKAIDVDEQGEALRWETVRGRCAVSCLLTAADFTD